MRIPKSPPSALEDLLAEAAASGRLGAVFTQVQADATSTERGSGEASYHHWDDLRHRPPPADLTHAEWWLANQLRRAASRRPLPFSGGDDRPFHYAGVDPIPERLHEIDLGAGGLVPTAAPGLRERLRVDSLISEAITSSQIEGATTTRRVAKDMLRSGRSPRDRSELMILNNFQTMHQIMRRPGAVKDEPLTIDLILEMHARITEGTLDDPTAAGRLRRPDEPIVVTDSYGEVLHQPPPAEALAERLEALCAFANGATPDAFVHPAIRAIALHFWLAYDHPFVDGNGRTARALFYWAMLHQGFWLFEFISISEVILKAPARYGRAFLLTETDDFDLTYFLLYHLDVIQRALAGLHGYLDRRAAELRELESELALAPTLNHRQRALLGHALRHPGFTYTVQSHRRSHAVAYDTARTDLLDLTERGLLVKARAGRKWVFQPAPGLESQVDRGA